MALLLLQLQLTELKRELFGEDYLGDRFKQLWNLHDGSEFARETMEFFFTETEKTLNELRTEMEQQVLNYDKVNNILHKLNGGSTSVGALRVSNACAAFQTSCKEHNRACCAMYFQQLKQEFSLLKTKLETLFSLEQRIIAAGGQP